MRPYANLKRDTAFAVFAIAIVAATSILDQIATYLFLGMLVLLSPISIRQTGFLRRCGFMR